MYINVLCDSHRIMSFVSWFVTNWECSVSSHLYKMSFSHLQVDFSSKEVLQWTRFFSLQFIFPSLQNGETKIHIWSKDKCLTGNINLSNVMSLLRGILWQESRSIFRRNFPISKSALLDLNGRAGSIRLALATFFFFFKPWNLVFSLAKVLQTFLHLPKKTTPWKFCMYQKTCRYKSSTASWDVDIYVVYDTWIPYSDVCT